jgi:hypothetical protein
MPHPILGALILRLHELCDRITAWVNVLLVKRRLPELVEVSLLLLPEVFLVAFFLNVFLNF